MVPIIFSGFILACYISRDKWENMNNYDQRYLNFYLKLFQKVVEKYLIFFHKFSKKSWKNIQIYFSHVYEKKV